MFKSQKWLTSKGHRGKAFGLTNMLPLISTSGAVHKILAPWERPGKSLSTFRGWCAVWHWSALHCLIKQKGLQTSIAVIQYSIDCPKWSQLHGPLSPVTLFQSLNAIVDSLSMLCLHNTKPDISWCLLYPKQQESSKRKGSLSNTTGACANSKRGSYRCAACWNRKS